MMTDYEYILTQCRKTDAASWSEEMIEHCITHVGALGEEEVCDLLFEKEIHSLGSIYPLCPEGNNEVIVINEMQDKLRTAIMKAVPTNRLVELMHSNPNDYMEKGCRERSMDFLNLFRQTYNLVREEVWNRFVSCADSGIEGNLFNKNQEMLRWQNWKQVAASIRYQDPYLKKFEKDEILITDEDLEYRLATVDNIISIEGCSRFWNEDRMRLGVVDYILWNLCGVGPQYIGIGDEVVFAVAPDDYNLHEDFDKTPLHDKIYEVIDKEYQRNLVLGCLLIEKFIHLVSPKAHAMVRYYDREYLVGHFVLEECNTYKLFGDDPFLSYMERMSPEEKMKFDSFLELAKILLNPPSKVLF